MAVLLENVGPHNDTRSKHLRLASGQGIRRGGPSVRVQMGGKVPARVPQDPKRAPIGNLLRSFRASVTVRVGPCRARGSCGPSGVGSFIIRALNAREENCARLRVCLPAKVPQSLLESLSLGVWSPSSGGLSNGPGSRPHQPVRA